MTEAVLNQEQEQEQRQLDKLKSFTNSVLPSFTGDMIQDMAEKAIKGVELADEILQPETLELLRFLPEISKNLERVLADVKRLEETGVLSSLFDIAQFAANAKKAVTGDMILDMTEKAISGVELADSLIQKGTIDIANQALTAFEEAKEERKGKKPYTKMQLLKQLNQPETLEGFSFFMTFIQKFSKEMNK
jgi:uncharacterized protein YjgD (DUF1641 family)